MSKWSEHYINIEMLEGRQSCLLSKENVNTIVDKIMLAPKKKVLEIGCGTGALTYAMYNKIQDAEYTAIDIDGEYIKYAQEKKQKYNNPSNIIFMKEDALNLPFPDDSFDIVVSLAFLTCIQDYKKALSEMKRVCKKNGKVASITSMSFYATAYDEGEYKNKYDWKEKYDELNKKVVVMYNKEAPLEKYIIGVKAKKVPYEFSNAGYKNVSVFPIAIFTSNSNNAINIEERKKYIEYKYLSDIKKFNLFCDEGLTNKYLKKEEIEEYLELEKRRKDDLIKNLGNDISWEWEGMGLLLVVGEKVC